jgi:hypothetical protein
MFSSGLMSPERGTIRRARNVFINKREEKRELLGLVLITWEISNLSKF